MYLSMCIIDKLPFHDGKPLFSFSPFLSFLFPPVPSPPFPFSSSILPSGVQSKRSIKRTSHNRLTIVAQSRPPILFDEISQVTKRVSIECYNSYKNVSRVTLTNQTSVIRVILGWLINLMTSQIFNKNINKIPMIRTFLLIRGKIHSSRNFLPILRFYSPPDRTLFQIFIYYQNFSFIR